LSGRPNENENADRLKKQNGTCQRGDWQAELDINNYEGEPWGGRKEKV